MIITAEQKNLLSYLSRYSQILYSFIDYKNHLEWTEEELKFETAIDAVKNGSYTQCSKDLENYINNCILCVEEMTTT